MSESVPACELQPCLQLRHVFCVSSGSTPNSSKAEFWDGDILWVTPEDVGRLSNHFLKNTRRRLTEDGYRNSGANLVPSGSIVVTKRAPIGQLAILSRAACSNQGCLLLSPKVPSDSRFYYYVLYPQTSWLHALGRGSTFMELSVDDLKALVIPLPPLYLQRAIADFLDRETAQIDTLVAEKEQWLSLLAEKRRSLITRAVTRGLNPDAPMKDSGEPWIGEIPEHWKISRAKFIFSQSSIPIRAEDEMVTCFRDGQVTLRKNRREEGFTNGDLELGYQGIRIGQLVLHSMDAFAGAIGISESDGKCSPEYIICDPIIEGVSSPYFARLIRTMALNGFIQAACPAVRERAPRIRFNDFGEMYFPLPPLAEQSAIVRHIEAETGKLDALRDAAVASLALLRERRAALIAAAVTGKIDVTQIGIDETHHR